MIISTVKKQSIHNVAIYLRLSKDDGDTEESESISNQRKIIYDYLNQYFNYEKCYEYVDDGFSGATFERPSFKKMICELKVNKIDLVITKNLARFARNYIESGAYIEKLFPNNNVRYIAILDGVDNFEDRIENELAPIRGVFNELFCKETSKGVKRTKRKKMSDGFYSCNVAPYGYKKDLDIPGKLIIDKIAAEVVRRIFELTLKGKTAKQIADLFNSEQIPTPAEYLKIKGLENRTKKVWTRTIIARILANEVYTGKCLRGKTQKVSYKSKKRIYIRRSKQILTEYTHEPIILEEIYNKIHNKNKYGSTIEKRIEIKAKFSKYMYCGKCKEKMAKRKSRNFINIHCPARNESDYLCSNNTLYNYEKLENIIIKNIKKEFSIFLDKDNLKFDLIKKCNDIKISQIETTLKSINKDLNMIRFKISKIYNDRLQESISEEEYIKVYYNLNEKRNIMVSDIQKLEKEKEEIHDENKNVEKIEKIKKIIKNINQETLSQADLDDLIEKIEIYENNIQIYYKFKKMLPQNFSC